MRQSLLTTKMNEKGFAPVLIIGVLAVILVVGTYFFWSRSTSIGFPLGPKVQDMVSKPTSRRIDAPKTNLIGLNPDMFSYYGMEKPLVDIIKLADPWKTLSGGKPRIDSHGWPLEDAQILLWAGQQDMKGTYKLSFLGKATVTIDSGVGRITNQTYDAVSNITTADLVCDDSGKNSMQLKFSNTTAGIKNVKIIRPGYTGTETFTTPYKTALSKASVLRFGFSNPVGNSEVNWLDRRLPTYFSQAVEADGTKDGTAWEFVIQLANELKKDTWIMVPAKATDDYVIKLAKLIKDGGTVEGVSYPGLDPSLNLYVEYSNEVWNPDPLFSEHIDNHDAAVAEVGIGKSALNYDGSTEDYVWAWRRVGKRIKEISDDFRQVFGDAAMGTRIRPILAAQQGTFDVGKEAITFIDNTYGGKHPVNYYLYGFGGSAYYNPDNNSDNLTLDSLFATMLTPQLVRGFQTDTDWALTYGLHHVAYEGGPTLDKTGHSETVKAASVNDPRMTSVMIAIHKAWTESGGELFNYCCGNGDYQWGFTDNINNLDTPKFRAIDKLNQSAPASLTYGALLPATLNAGRFSISSGTPISSDNPIQLKPFVFGPNFNPNSVYWTAYTVRTDKPGTYQISFNLSSRQAGELKVFIDGNPLETLSIQDSNGTDKTSSLLNINLEVGLHSIRLQSIKGEFNIRSILIKS